MWIVIGQDGKARDVKVVRPLGMGLDEKAIEAISSWRFEPASKDGKPVAAAVKVEVTFRLDASKGPRTPDRQKQVAGDELRLGLEASTASVVRARLYRQRLPLVCPAHHRY